MPPLPQDSPGWVQGTHLVPAAPVRTPRSTAPPGSTSPKPPASAQPIRPANPHRVTCISRSSPAATSSVAAGRWRAACSSVRGRAAAGPGFWAPAFFVPCLRRSPEVLRSCFTSQHRPLKGSSRRPKERPGRWAVPASARLSCTGRPARAIGYRWLIWPTGLIAVPIRLVSPRWTSDPLAALGGAWPRLAASGIAGLGCRCCGTCTVRGFTGAAMSGFDRGPPGGAGLARRLCRIHPTRVSRGCPQ